MLETALALGADVVAGAALILYRRLVVEPTVPGDVVGLDLRGSLHFQALLRAAPDLILSAPWYGSLEGNLGCIAPVLSLRIDQRGRPPYAAAMEATRVAAARTGLAGEAERVIAETEAALAAAAQRLAPRRGERLFVISVGDPRHFRSFGPDSMHGAVLDRLGLTSAWGRNTCYFAQAPVDITALAQDPGADIVIVGSPPPTRPAPCRGAPCGTRCRPCKRTVPTCWSRSIPSAPFRRPAASPGYSRRRWHEPRPRRRRPGPRRARRDRRPQGRDADRRPPRRAR